MVIAPFEFIILALFVSKQRSLQSRFLTMLSPCAPGWYKGRGQMIGPCYPHHSLRFHHNFHGHITCLSYYTSSFWKQPMSSQSRLLANSGPCAQGWAKWGGQRLSTPSPHHSPRLNYHFYSHIIILSYYTSSFWVKTEIITFAMFDHFELIWC